MPSPSIFKKYVALKILLTIGLTCLSRMLVGQVTIKGKITGGDHYLPSATVILLAVDSAFVKGVVTDTTGLFVFDEVTSGDYLISASMVGYAKFISSRISVSSSDLVIPDVQLAEISTSLNEVEVKAE